LKRGGFPPRQAKTGLVGGPGLAPRGFDVCDPLPIKAQAEGYKNKKTGKMTPIQQGKTTERGVRLVGHRSVELKLSVCLQQNAYGGWGRGLKDTGRGLQSGLRRSRSFIRGKSGRSFRMTG